MSNYTVQWASGGTQGIPGKSSIIIADGETDSLNTSLTLTGRDVVEYGQIQQDNFVQLLENSASIFSPPNPTVGQLWYNVSATSAGQLYTCIAPAGTNAQPPNSFEAQCIPGVTQSGSDGSFWAPVSYLYRPLNATGDTMSGPLSMGSNIISNLNVSSTPNANDAVNVGYMESRIAAIVGGSVVDTYTAGTGLALNGNIFSNTGLLTATGGQNISVSVGQNPVISLVGTVPSASYAANAGTITVNPDSTNTSYTVAFLSSTTGSSNILSNADLTFNPSNGQLTTTAFVGSLLGNAQTATLATSASKLSGGGTGYLPYQSAANNTIMLAPGTSGQILTISGGVPSWQTPVYPASVTSFNTRTGVVTLASSDVVSALGYSPQSNLGFTPVQQGGGGGQAANKIYIGWNTGGTLYLQVDSTNFSGTWPINIQGSAASATHATTATTATNGGVTSVNGSTGAVTVEEGLGVNQSWTSQSRAIGTWYQNTTGRPIKVSISCQCNGDQTGSYFDMGASTGSYVTLTITAKGADFYLVGDVIPPNWYYRMRATSTNPSVSAWLELR